MKIFILEDLIERQNAFKEKFKEHVVKIVDNVKDAIKILEVESFDLIYLDHDLDGKSGVDVNDPNCGSRVAEYLANKKYQGLVITGSLNPVGVENIKRLLPSVKVRPNYWNEPNMITNFKDKKLVEYLKDGQKVLILSHNGLGDCIMSYPIYQKLKELYPKIEFTIYLENDQDKIFPSVNKIEEEKYDLVFSPNFPMSESSGITKSEKCCIDEIGIPPICELAELPKYESPLVLTHWQGTALPDSVNCPPEIAEKIWNEIKEFGFVPMEPHWCHVFHNPRNVKYDFINRHVRDCKVKIEHLLGLIQHSWAFVGVLSGPAIVSLSIMPKHCFILEKNHKLTDYLKEDFIKEHNIKHINITDYQDGMVKQWLETLK